MNNIAPQRRITIGPAIVFIIVIAAMAGAVGFASLASTSGGIPGVTCRVNLSGFPSFQNQTAKISDLSLSGLSSNSSAYSAIERVNVTELDVQMSHEPAFRQTVSGYVWVRAGWLPYTALNTNGSRWGTYFPFGENQNKATPSGVAFFYEVYGHDGTWYGGFFSAYDLQNGNFTFSPFHPRAQCPPVP